MANIVIATGQTASPWRSDGVDGVLITLTGASANPVVATTIETSIDSGVTNVATYKQGTPLASVAVPAANESVDYFGLPAYRSWRLKIAGAQGSDMVWYASKQTA